MLFNCGFNPAPARTIMALLSLSPLLRPRLLDTLVLPSILRISKPGARHLLFKTNGAHFKEAEWTPIKAKVERVDHRTRLSVLVVGAPMDGRAALIWPNTRTRCSAISLSPNKHGISAKKTGPASTNKIWPPVSTPWPLVSITEARDRAMQAL